MSKIFDKMFELDDADIVGKSYLMKVACEGAICDECDPKKTKKKRYEYFDIETDAADEKKE